MLELNGATMAAAGLAVLGWLAYQARGLGRWVWEALRRRCVTRLTVTDDHQQFPALLGWLSRRMPDHREVQPANVGSDRLLPAGSHQQRRTVGTRMAPGSTWFWLGGRPCWVTYTRADTATGGRSRPVESLSLTFLSRDPNTPAAVLRQAEAEADEPGTIQAMFQQGYSLPVHRIPSRPLTTVDLPGDQAADLLDDARLFFESADLYQRRGVPHRRGYLLEGPPGTGKTSLAVALATELRLPLVVLTLGDTFDQQLGELMRQVPQGGAIILIEDIDCATAAGSRTHWRTEGRGPDEPAVPGRLTLSGLLNSLDGVSAPTNVLVVFTSNHPDRLDPALVRPGRVDRRVKFGKVTADQAHAMWGRFFPDAMGGEAFGVEMEMAGKTAAEVQQELMRTGEVTASITTAFGVDMAFDPSQPIDPRKISLEKLPHLNYPASVMHICPVCRGSGEFVFMVDGQERREPCATCRPLAWPYPHERPHDNYFPHPKVDLHADVPTQDAHRGSHPMDRAEHPRRDGFLPVTGGDEQPPARR